MKYSDKCVSAAQALLMKILSNDSLKEIHSARYRVKTVESLLIKYVKKKALLPKEPGNDYNIEKYRPMNGKNYHKIITDLIGIRILIQIPKAMELVHDWIMGVVIKEEDRLEYNGFVNNLKYVLRYRVITPQMLETVLESYAAGRIFERSIGITDEF